MGEELGAERSRWATCGAMALTGDADGPPLAPCTNAAEILDRVLGPFGLNAEVLGERAALLGLGRQGRTSCGGAARLIQAADGWIALSLPRPEDRSALGALLHCEIDEASVTRAASTWPVLEPLVRTMQSGELLSDAQLLGIACSLVGEYADAPAASPFACADSTLLAAIEGLGKGRVVVELASLWAGPFCGDLLRRTGATVIKVEDRNRPETSRTLTPEHFDLLNAHKASVALDFRSATDRDSLHKMIASADVVVSSARARAIHQLGLDPETFVSSSSGRVWVAITGYGWHEDRIGFGDDAAVAAGLVAWSPNGGSPGDGSPRFASDAVADPLCGALAAHEVLCAWKSGQKNFVDASLVEAARSVASAGTAQVARNASAAGDQSDWRLGESRVALPKARYSLERARPLGADNDMVLDR